MNFKHFYPLLAVFASSGTYAQVGINTPQPQSTFDIVGNAASTSAKDGVTAPRITRQQLAAKVAGTYAAAQAGTLVYVTNAGTPTGTTPSLAQTTDITKVGYYYFDGTVWKQISDTDSPSVNIYNSDGTLTNNRVVTQGANTLAFTSTAVNGFSVDGSTLSVDAANDRVGIGTTIPRSRFDIVADNLGGGAPNDFSFTGYGTSKNPALFLASASGTVAAPANLLLNDIIGSVHFTPRVNGVFQTGSAIFSNYRGDGTNNSTDLGLYTSGVERIRIDPVGNVGIGTNAPQNRLDLGATAGSNITDVAGKKLAVYNTATGSSFYGLGVSSNTLQLHASSAATDAPGAVLTNTGNFGIGNTSPSVKLDVNSGGTSTAPVTAVKIVDGNQAVGKVLTSDAAGLATWQTPATQSSVNIYNTDGSITGNRTVTLGANTLTFASTAVNGFSVDGTTLSVDAANNRIGLGTIAPVTKFDIVADNAGAGAGNDMNFTGYGTSKNPALFLSSAGGTLAAPTNLVNGDIAGSIYFTSRANNSGTNSIISSAYRGDGTTALTDLMFATSGTERMRIDPIGNVGIGNASPTVKLDINSGGTSTTPVTAVKIVDGNQAAGRVLTSDANGLATWQDAATSASVNIYNTNGSLTGNRVVTQGANTLAFTSTATNGFSVDGATLSVDAANDRVGIGTTAPVAKIDAVGTTFGMRTAGIGTWDNLWFDLANTSAPAINASGAETGLQFKVGANVTGTYGDGQTLTTIATMRPNGNMGIGTANPSTTLHVATTDEGIISERFASGGGNWPTLVLRRSGSATLGTNAAVASGNGLGAIVFAGNTGSGYNTDYTGTSSSIRSNSTQAFSGSAMGSNMTFFTVANGTNAAAQRMILTHDGNVGIGTSTPTSLLSVNGSADKPGGGSWGTFSDRRVKKDINEFKDGLNVINQLKPVVYKYTEKSGYTDLNKEYVGFIAQEVEKAAPYMVNVIDDSAKSGLKDKRELDESALTKILVNAVKEQQKEIELLKTQVKELLELNKKK